MEVRQQESYLKEAGRLGGFFQSSEREECSVSEAGGQEGFVRPGAGGSGWGNSESLLFRAWDILAGESGLCGQGPPLLLRGRPRSARSGCSGSCCHGDTKAPLRALEVLGMSCPQHGLKPAAGVWLQLGQQRASVGPCRAQHQRHRRRGSHWL